MFSTELLPLLCCNVMSVTYYGLVSNSHDDDDDDDDDVDDDDDDCRSRREVWCI